MLPLILLYGYKAIGTFGEQRREVALIEFQDDIRAAVARVAIDYGSVKKFVVNVPADFDEICFIDLETVTTKGMPAFIQDERPLIANEIEGGSNQNLFLRPFPDQPLKIPKISVGGEHASEGYLCIKNTRVGMVLKLTGLGDRAKIELWPTQ